MECAVCGGKGCLTEREGNTTIISPCLLCGGVLKLRDAFQRETQRVIVPKGSTPTGRQLLGQRIAELRQEVERPVRVPISFREKLACWIARMLGVPIGLA